MKILVISDSHGDCIGVQKIIEHQNDAQIIIFCGDGAVDIDNAKLKYTDKKFYCVKGNGDFDSNYPIMDLIKIEGKKILFTHGHSYYVKQNLKDLMMSAKIAKAHIVLYGHTHIAKSEYIDGIYYINPGSLRGYTGTFATIEITDKGILPNLILRAKVGI